MKKGLVMEGGAMRGMFTCGVIDVLMENGIDFDCGVGVSAGATFGINFKSKQIGRPLRYNKKYCKDKRYGSISSWLKTGDLYDVPFCYGTLPWELDQWDTRTFYQNPMDFYCVVTDVETGQPHYHKCVDTVNDINWIRASASIPVFSRPVHIGEGIYLDGGMSDSIPLKFMEDQGCDKILVIETQPYDYVKPPQGNMAVIKTYLRKYPQMIKTIQGRYKMYNAQKDYVKEREKMGKVFVIRPAAPLNIGAAEKNPDQLQRVYDLGREQMEKYIDILKEYLGE
ncbi:MAG: patatin family protein [Pseudobutyrivibrio sp.]|nr:patatin family protein [Pseudobutyrivibrio sp.]